MQEINRLKQLRDQIIGIEMHLTVVQADLGAIDRDIEFLEDLALVLTENISVLKSDKIIAVASEYKKAVEELKTVDTNLQYYFAMKATLTRDYNRHMQMREDSIVEYEALKEYVDNRRVVLQFDLAKRKK